MPLCVVPRRSPRWICIRFCCGRPPPSCAVVATPTIPPPFACCPLVGITPGASAANDNGFRPRRGRSNTGRVLITVPTPEVCASSCTALACTSTDSDTVPTSILPQTCAGSPTHSGRFCRPSARAPTLLRTSPHARERARRPARGRDSRSGCRKGGGRCGLARLGAGRHRCRYTHLLRASLRECPNQIQIRCRAFDAAEYIDARFRQSNAA